MRQTIFISHATPDDNILASWLAARLASLGYRVWVDLDQLKGGDPFWRDIQSAIREQAVRFLCVVTQVSVNRQGVLNEIAEACGVAKALKDPRFIIPIRGDGVSWDDFPIQLKTLNGVDFSESWHRGLVGVLDAFNRDGIPFTEGNPEVSRTAHLIATSTNSIRDVPEEAILNRLQIRQLPDSIHYFRTALSATDLLKHHALAAWPHAPFQRLLLGFLEIEAARPLTPDVFEIELAYTAPTEQFASGTAVGVPGIKGADARRMLVSILRQGFDDALSKAGLINHGDGRWFVPSNWRSGNVGRYRKANGKLGDRVLVGKAKELTWHFGLSFNVDAGRSPRIDLRPEVLFSPDGVRPFEDQKQLRRKHCKLWWNDRWRDLLQTLLAELFGLDAETVDINLGGTTSMQVSCRLSRLTLAKSYDAASSFMPATEEDAEEFVDTSMEDGSEE